LHDVIGPQRLIDMMVQGDVIDVEKVVDAEGPFCLVDSFFRQLDGFRFFRPR